MISAWKLTLNQNNLKILRPKVKKNIKNLCKKFCESPPRCPSLFVGVTFLKLLTLRTAKNVKSIKVKIAKCLFERRTFWYNVKSWDKKFKSQSFGNSLELPNYFLQNGEKESNNNCFEHNNISSSSNNNNKNRESFWNH